MNALAITEAIQLALSGISLLRTLGATSAEIKALLEQGEDQSTEELMDKLNKRQSEIEARANNEVAETEKK
jgi:DNA-binding transcriptional MerR regulator